MFFTFVKSLENEEEKVQILILFLEDLDFIDDTEFGYFFYLRRFIVIFKLL